MSLWKAAGITPSGSWYVVTHDFMTASLRCADTENAYLLTDSSTFIVERKDLANLKVLRRGDAELVGKYGRGRYRDPLYFNAAHIAK